MQPFKRLSWAEFRLLSLMVTCVCRHAQSASATADVNGGGDTPCQRLRRDISLLLQQVYVENSYPVFLKDTLPDWVEMILPHFCSQQRKYTIRSSKNGNDGSLKTSVFRFNEFAGVTQKSMLNVDKNNNENGTLIPRENTVAKEIVIRNRRGTSSRELNDLHSDGLVYRVKRFLVDGLFGGSEFRGLPRNRFNLDPTRQPRQFAQKIDYIIKLKYPHMITVSLGNPTLKRQRSGYIRDQTNLGTMEFGTVYHRRNKRELNEANAGKSATMKRRTKRFLFGEAAELQPMPSLFSIMMGTAQDPNTGKIIEFGGDIMRNMMVNSFTSLLPLAAQPPPGREPNDLVKIMAPVWYFSNMQQAMGSPRSSNTRTYDRKQNQHGYYGDIVPGKRKRRSPSSESSSSWLQRH